MGECIFCWNSKKQSVVAHSTAEAEYIAAFVAANQLVWLRKILKDLDCDQVEPTELFCDNMSVIAISKNSVLLIWEECHSESKLCSIPPRTSGTENQALPLGEWEGYLGSDVHSSQFGVHEMMENNQVIIVGEGIVGLAAFTGSHEWILANNCRNDTHPPEVLNEVHHRFSAGMQTIVVVPVCPHGVLQLGSSSADSFNQQIISSQAASRIVGRPSCSQPRQIQDNELASSSAINIHNVTKIFAKYCDDFCEPKNIPVMKPDNPFMDQLANGVVGAEVIPSNPGAWLNQQTASCNSRPEFNHQPIINSLAMSYVRTNEGHSLASPAGSHISVQLPNEVDGQTRQNSIPCSLLKLPKLADINHSSTFLAGVGIQNAGSSGAEEVHLSSLLGRFSASGILSGSSNPEYHPANVKHTENEICAVEEKVLPSGDELYDILACVKAEDMFKDSLALTSIREVNSDLFSLNEGISDRNMFSDMGTDHLLDAVVSRVHAAAKQIQMKMLVLPPMMVFEVGSRSMVSPIIVEDLNPPSQMLVEMLCEEQGFFLEIANSIRGLGLTILDITRMEIFMSLVQHLEQAVKGSAAALGALENDDMKAHLTFPQTSSMPATGMPIAVCSELPDKLLKYGR
ncbi:transcription factor LHW [Salix suchowensis]|nr:transcription factor LHW [Salix suchowensis]